MMTISRLARRFNLSRSTLLYYDRIGLLRPSGRSPANYRLYTEADRRRLQAICHYRQIGLSLKAIARILGASPEGAGGVLKQRLQEIDQQIEALGRQRNVIHTILGKTSGADLTEGMTRAKWTTLLRASGMTDADMHQWHVEFERLFPGDHEVFLASLGIPPEEVDAIRAFSRDDGSIRFRSAPSKPGRHYQSSAD